MFKEIPHTADVALYIESTTYKGLFYDAALGLNTISDIELSSENSIYFIIYKDKANDKESLLVNWLNFLIYQLDNYLYLISSNIFIYRNSLFSSCYFKKYKKRNLLIKSATFHNLNIIKTKNLIHTCIVFDI
ncbi:MAG: archease [Candidatus Kapaibacteriota bacterium]